MSTREHEVESTILVISEMEQIAQMARFLADSNWPILGRINVLEWEI